MSQFEIDRSDQNIYQPGLTKLKGAIHVSVEAAAKECFLILCPGKVEGKEAEPPIRIPFPEEGRMGNMWEMTVRGKNLERYSYIFEADGKQFPDPCGRSFTGHEEWGRPENANELPQTPIRQKTFDWEGDRPLRIPYAECIVYRVHVRGFTKHPSSGVAGRGTFRGILEKIPYLQELGITTLELLPMAEFCEVMMPEYADGAPYGRPEPTGTLNYWGYTKAYAFAPKASYAGRQNDPVTEMKKLVKALHQAGIELVLEMFFCGKEPPSYVLEAVCHWVREYHIDGVHIVGYAPFGLLARDPRLADTKLWASCWSSENIGPQKKKRLGEYNEGFLQDMRRILKGDDGQMRALAVRTRKNPPDFAQLNFIAGTNGFTMMDMVSYEHKHNEANGEENHDGTDYNYSWNCGEEGPTRKKKVAAMRRRQLFNAFAMLFLSQGVPVLLAGDEFGNSQKGNNNAYCQDNEISWLNWRLLKQNRDLFEYVKTMIAFRKAHPVFCQEKELSGRDILACGYPDISYHGSRAWVPAFEAFSRELGIMYCGEYARRRDGNPDNFFYVAYNMHWDAHQFALPNLPPPLSWHLAADTAATEAGGQFHMPGAEPELDTQRQLEVPAHSIRILIARPGTLNPGRRSPRKVEEKTPKAKR